MAPTEFRALLVLLDAHKGLYGSELIERSGGALPRGTIYALMDKLITKGLVVGEEVPPQPGYRAPRRLHRLTPKGRRAINEYLVSLNLERKGAPLVA